MRAVRYQKARSHHRTFLQIVQLKDHYTYLKQSSSILTFETIYFWLEFLGIFFFYCTQIALWLSIPCYHMQLMEKKISQISNSTFHKIKVQTNKQTTSKQQTFFFFFFFFLFFLEAQIEYTKSKREDVFPLPFGKTDSVFLFASFFLKCCNIRSLREIKGLFHVCNAMFFSYTSAGGFTFHHFDNWDSICETGDAR